MRISVQSQDLVDHYGIREAYKMIADAGFEAIDWNIDHALKHSDVVKADELKGLSIFEQPMDEILVYYKEELDALKENGLAITQAHSPFPPDIPGRPEVLEYTIDLYTQMIKFCQIAGVPRLIIHGMSQREPYPELSKAENEENNIYMYSRLIPALQECPDVTVCLENLFSRISVLGAGYWAGSCSDPHEAAEIIDKLNEKAGRRAFGLCLDTGHLNLLRRTFESYVPVLNDRIVCLHIHDNMQNDDAHLMPYTGNIHWESFVKELKEIGYSGDLSFETFMQVSRKRTPAELVPVFLSTIHSIGEYFKSQIQQ